MTYGTDRFQALDQTRKGMIRGHLLVVLEDSDHEPFNSHGSKLEDQFVVEYFGAVQAVSGRLEVLAAGQNMAFPSGDGGDFHGDLFPEVLIRLRVKILRTGKPRPRSDLSVASPPEADKPPQYACM